MMILFAVEEKFMVVIKNLKASKKVGGRGCGVSQNEIYICRGAGGCGECWRYSGNIPDEDPE